MEYNSDNEIFPKAGKWAREVVIKFFPDKRYIYSGIIFCALINRSH